MKIFLTLVIAALMLAGCGTTVTTTNGSNTNVANANTTTPPANTGVLEPTKKPEVATTNNAPTLAPVVQTYYEALKKKDDALLRTVMSQEFLKSIEADMKEEGKKAGIAAYMAETDTIPEKPVEVRNERIEGNNGVAELKGGAYLTWTPFAFINEGGKWKFSGGSPILK